MPEFTPQPIDPLLDAAQQRLIILENEHRNGASENLPPAYPLNLSHIPRDLAVFLKDKKGLRRVQIVDIFLIAADGNYVEMHLRNGRVVLRNSISEILRCLPKDIFFMVNRSQAVNILLVDGIGNDEVSIGKRSFTLTRRYRDELLGNLHIVAGR
jgi:DNA-binding LytR/AlgR family response regulator